MGNLHPALNIVFDDADRLLWVMDDVAPIAVEEHDARGVTAFFRTTAERDRAQAVFSAALPGVVLSPLDVDDEDWARRSQEDLGPVVVDQLTVAPPWSGLPSGTNTIVILPSTGFGTGHHATTRLCLAALQRIELKGRAVLDVGTGSGVLTLAACALGASSALGIDVDPDAIRAADENLELNPAITDARFELLDLQSAALPTADVVTANLTGALLAKEAERIASAVRPGGTLVVSGLQVAEEAMVQAAFAAPLELRAEEDGWVALTFRPVNPAGRSSPRGV